MSESATAANKPKRTTTTSIPSPTTTTVIPTFTPLQATKGDTDLLGNPSKVGGFNVTTGVILYSAFLFAFLVAVGFATVRRAQLRKKLRLESENQDSLSAIEAGHVMPGKDMNEKGGDAASKQSTDSRKPLTEAGGNHEVGRNARLAEAAAKSRLEADEANKRAATPTGERRQEHSRSGSNVVRFDENGGTSRSGSLKRTQQQPSFPEKSPARRASARKNTASPDVDSEKYMSDSIARYQDDFQDTADYSVPALTASTLDDNPSIPPQVPRPIYQQAAVRPAQPSMKRSHTTTTPAARPPRAASHGLVSRSGSVASQSSRSSSATAQAGERDYYHGRSASSGSATLEHQSLGDRHPTSIKRSNSSRLPPSMRVGTPSAHESGTYM